MTSTEISNTRLFSQNIENHEFTTTKELVSWMGAVQAQDYAMAKWAIGVRLNDHSNKDIESSFNKGEIIRLHVLRPTWHFVSADDVYWILELNAEKIKRSLKSRLAGLELTETVIAKTSRILENKLSGGISLTRDEIANEFHRANIKTDNNRLSHILFRAEMDGIVCSGPLKDKNLTYALLRERVPFRKTMNHDESLAELAKRYFSSHCPATMEDFAWWSNLSAADARKALQLIKDDFHPESIGTSVYLIPNSGNMITKKTSVHLLPAYDEFLISYKDRSCSLSLVNNNKTVSSNGIFYPLIVLNGQVAGTWKRIFKKNKVIVEINFFHPPVKADTLRIEKKAVMFGKFWDKETEIPRGADYKLY